jgi:hypothetical protein
MITINNKKMIAHNSTREFSDALDLRYVHERRLEKKYIYIYISISQRIGVQKSGNEISFKPKIQYTQNLILSHKTKGITLALILWQRVVFFFYEHSFQTCSAVTKVIFFFFFFFFFCHNCKRFSSFSFSLVQRL